MPGVIWRCCNDVEVVRARSLATETVQRAALSLKSIDNIEGCDRLSLGVLGVCDCVANDALEEGLENTTSLFVDHCRNAST